MLLTLLIALAALWALGSLVALGLCRAAATGDRALPRPVRLAAHRTHEFHLAA